MIGRLAGTIDERGIMVLGGVDCPAAAAFGYLMTRHQANLAAVKAEH